MFNLRAPDTEESTKKPTKMLTTSRSAARNFRIRCDGSHSYRVVGGSLSFMEGQRRRMSLNEYCGGYTEELATTMVEGFEEELMLISHLTNVVNKKRALDDLEEEVARRVARRLNQPGSSDDHLGKKKRRREFAEELREMMKRAKLPRPVTRSMTRGSSSRQPMNEEETPQTQEEDHEEAMEHWIDDMEENIPYVEPDPEIISDIQEADEDTPMM